MSFGELYLLKQQIPPLIHENPDPELGMIVIIPAFRELFLLDTLLSLDQCTRPTGVTEVIVLVNSSVNCSLADLEVNKQVIDEVSRWIEQREKDKLHFHLVHQPNLPPKHAGVGLARKIAMDEAVCRFHEINKPNGIIVSFDADSTCSPNYLVSIQEQFEREGLKSATIPYRHLLPADAREKEGILQYELHLRYLVQSARFCGFPYWWHTVGSAFAVRAWLYVAVGGMNRRKAGEDFYFLHKVFPHGNVGIIRDTCIYPSPRASDRVPFGTGAAMNKWINEPGEEWLTYRFEAYEMLKPFFEGIPGLFRASLPETRDFIQSMHPFLVEYLQEHAVIEELEECKRHAARQDTFLKRFYQWFDGFRLVRFLNTMHEDHFTRSPVRKEAAHMLMELGIANLETPGSIELLEKFRELDTA
jgi:hypothetical protein